MLGCLAQPPLALGHVAGLLRNALCPLGGYGRTPFAPILPWLGAGCDGAAGAAAARARRTPGHQSRRLCSVTGQWFVAWRRRSFGSSALALLLTLLDAVALHRGPARPLGIVELNLAFAQHRARGITPPPTFVAAIVDRKTLEAALLLGGEIGVDATALGRNTHALGLRRRRLVRGWLRVHGGCKQHGTSHRDCALQPLG